LYYMIGVLEQGQVNLAWTEKSCTILWMY
jgi:hypothetical protein